MVYRVYWSELR